MKLTIHRNTFSSLKVLFLAAAVAISAQTFASSSITVVEPPSSFIKKVPSSDSPVFKIYPNPSDGKSVGLVLENVLNQQGTLTIYNSIGSKVFNKAIQAKGASKNLSIELEKPLRKGLYLLTFSIGEKHHTERLVIK